MRDDVISQMESRSKASNGLILFRSLQQRMDGRIDFGMDAHLRLALPG
jgi:hypothetical protein